MMRLRICPRCLGEGKRQEPLYGRLVAGTWQAPYYEAALSAVSSEPCRPCAGSGYLKLLRAVA